MLDPVLAAHSAYREHLEELEEKFSNQATITNKTGTELEQKRLNYKNLIRQQKLEIESSLLTIDMMFTSLKELRLAFIMHVHFQCTLKYLDRYRRELEELRKIIQPLPDQLRDASSS
jgi:hypothetical protein